jgi:hypothetical protein
MWFVRIPRSEVPADGLTRWLDDRWLDLDRAVGAELVKDERHEQ